MNKEKDFFKTYVDTVAGLEVKNESQAIAKEVVLSEIENLQQENKQLKEQLLVTQSNEETFSLEMEDITKTLRLDDDTLFDDVKVYARSLKDNWNKLKEYIMNDINSRNNSKIIKFEDGRKVMEIVSSLYSVMQDKSKTMKEVLDKMEEIEQGSENGG